MCEYSVVSLALLEIKTLMLLFCFFFFLNVERERMSRGGAERERENPKWAHTVSTDRAPLGARTQEL